MTDYKESGHIHFIPDNYGKARRMVRLVDFSEMEKHKNITVNVNTGTVYPVDVFLQLLKKRMPKSNSHMPTFNGNSWAYWSLREEIQQAAADFWYRMSASQLKDHTKWALRVHYTGRPNEYSFYSRKYRIKPWFAKHFFEPNGWAKASLSKITSLVVINKTKLQAVIEDDEIGVIEIFPNSKVTYTTDYSNPGILLYQLASSYLFHQCFFASGYDHLNFNLYVTHETEGSFYYFEDSPDKNEVALGM